MGAEEAKNKLYEISSYLTNEEQREAISVAIRAIKLAQRIYLW